MRDLVKLKSLGKHLSVVELKQPGLRKVSGRNRGFYISAHILLNLLNEFRKYHKLRDFVKLFLTSFIYDSLLFQHWEECLEKLGGEQDVYRGNI